MKKWAKDKNELKIKFDIIYHYSIKMILRSGRMIGSDQISINFDEASIAWRKNKIHLGEGIFKYKLNNY